VNLAQDFSPGTSLWANGLVPEARLTPCSTDEFDCLSTCFSHSLGSWGILKARPTHQPIKPLRNTPTAVVRKPS